MQLAPTAAKAKVHVTILLYIIKQSSTMLFLKYSDANHPYHAVKLSATVSLCQN